MSLKNDANTCHFSVYTVHVQCNMYTTALHTCGQCCLVHTCMDVGLLCTCTCV